MRQTTVNAQVINSADLESIAEWINDTIGTLVDADPLRVITGLHTLHVVPASVEEDLYNALAVFTVEVD